MRIINDIFDYGLSFSRRCMAVILVCSLNTSVAKTVISVQNGIWNDPATWDCACFPSITDDVVIFSGHVIVHTVPVTINDLTINNGGVLYDFNTVMTVTGNLTVNGTYSGTNDLILTGSGIIIDGIGIINNTALLNINGNATISSSANLTKANGQVRIGNGVIVTNNGTIIIGDPIVGVSASSSWVNAAGAALKVGKDLLTTGVLIASAPDNTVEYYGAPVQDIKTPGDLTYYHLVISGTGNKVLVTDINIDGNFTINGLFDCNNFNIYLRGNWNSKGAFDERNATVIFDGPADQTVTSILGETFYNLSISKSGGNLILNNAVIVSNTLTMSGGNVDASSNKLTLGTSTADEGTLIYTDGQVIGELERWIANTGTGYLFPVGTNSHYLPAQPTFNAIATGGSVIAKFIESDPGNNGLWLIDGTDTIYNTFVEGYWDLTEANGFSSGDYDLELTGNGFTAFPIDSATRLLIRTDAVSPWITGGTHIAAVGSTAKRNNINTFPAQYAFGDDADCGGPVTSAITGDTSVCTGDAGVAYSVNNTSGSTYNWSIKGGTQASGGTANIITIDWGVTGMAGKVRVVENNGCTNGAPVDLSVTINTLSPSTITGKVNVAELTIGEPYSVTAAAGYTYTWTVTGGAIATGQGTNSITADWGAAGAGNVSVVAGSACGSSPAVDLDVSLYIVAESIITGDWTNPATWNCSCVPVAGYNVRIKNTHTVTLTSTTTINHLIIDAGGILNDGGNYMFVNGDFTVNGEYSGTEDMELKGISSTIDGTGIISHTGQISIVSGNKTILTSAILTKVSGNVRILDNIMVTNNGNITLGGNLIGAATSVWNNEVNSTLNIGGDLLANGTLIATATGNTVNFNRTAANQNVKTPVGGAYYNLTISGAGTKNLEDNIIVTGMLTLDEGKLDPGIYTLTISYSGSVIANNGYTVSLERKMNDISTAYYYPVGNDGIYRPINIIPGTGNYIIEMELRNYNPDLDGYDRSLHNPQVDTIYPNYYWYGEKTKGGSDFDIIFYYDDADTGVSEIRMTIVRWEGTEWINIGEGIDTIVNAVIARSGFGGLGPFALAGISEPPLPFEPLPVELLSFDARLNRVTAQSVGTVKVVVDITWATASEINNDYFTVEKSGNPQGFQNPEGLGLDWKTVTIIPGAGNSNQSLHYTAVDTEPDCGISYYRLKQTDYNGKYTYSDIVAVNYETLSGLDVYPNPTNGDFYIDINGNKDDKVLVVVLDLLGKEHYSKVIIPEDSEYTFAIDPSDKLSPGVYMVVASNKNNIYKKKIVIQ
ncbi:MAG: T9SS type A sorting domain-containing protein [Bacteroidota bacterium]